METHKGSAIILEPLEGETKRTYHGDQWSCCVSACGSEVIETANIDEGCAISCLPLDI
jgi:hypothetical protein